MRDFSRPMAHGTVLLSLLVLVEAVQLVIISGLVSIFIPAKMDPFNATIFSVYQSSIKASPQMLIYHIFILSCIAGQAAGMVAFKGKLEDAGFQEKIKYWLCMDCFWLFVQCYAIFKILIYKDTSWTWELFYMGLAASVLCRIFGVEIRDWLGRLEIKEQPKANKAIWAPSLDHCWTALFAVVESTQITIAANWLTGQNKASPVFLFVIFIMSTMILWAWMRLKKVPIATFKPFIIAEALLTFFLLSALYKMVIYDYRAQLATEAYHVLLLVAVLNKIGWKFLWPALKRFWALVEEPRNLPALRTGGDIFFALMIILMINIPDPQAVLAKMFVGDEFIHTNCFVMAPGWAYVKGCLLGVDVMSRYGLGIPIIVGTLAQAFGQYSYLSVFLAILWICIVYYLFCYLFLRVWLKSYILAVAAILMGIKTQLFYSLSFPQPFTYSSATPARFMLDIIFMLFIWGHINTQRWIYLFMAAICAGASFFCVPETGLYLAVAFFAYMILLALVPPSRKEMFGSVPNMIKSACCALMVPGSACILLWGYLGQHMLTKDFWDNITEISKLYTSGFWMGPFYGGLQYGQFWDLLIGMAFPIVYILTILIIGTLCVLRKLPKEHMMAVVLSAYGLMAHHYYVVMATANNYYPRGLPFVFVVFYWIGLGLSRIHQPLRRRLAVILLAFCAYCLWTNHHYLSYPNIFNFSRNPMVDPLVTERLPDGRYYLNHRYINTPEDQKLPYNSLGNQDEDLRTDKDFKTDEELKAYYEKETEFTKDVQLIHQFTSPEDPVALLSSYETEMLMKADRKPFFYYFRIFTSRPLRMRTFGSVDIWTTTEMNKTINQLETLKKKYVFMERVFLEDPTPKQKAGYDPALVGILDYVKSHYHPVAYGEFLVAMERNG